MRILAMAYSLVCYFAGVAALVLLILFIGDLLIPVTINQPSPMSPNLPIFAAIVANTVLIILWGLQHSIMADTRFKSWWTRMVPPAIERSTFLLFVAIATCLLIALWSPIPIMLWDVTGTVFGTALLAGYILGWALVLFSSFLINHFQLFGLEQAYRLLTHTQSKKAIFVTPLLYRIVRHPMMTGVLISLWCAPSMSVGRLMLNIVMTVYILAGTKHEEETLVADLGEEYENYRETTPMLLPNVTSKKLLQSSMLAK